MMPGIRIPGGAAPPATTGWQTRYEVDFRTQPSHDFTVTATASVKGVTWTAVNGANANLLRVESGGLRIYPVAATNLTTSLSGATAPYVWFALRDVLTDLDYDTTYRIITEWSWITGPLANYDRLHLGIWMDDNDSVNAGRYWAGGDTLTDRRVVAGGQSILDQAASGEVVHGLLVKGYDASHLHGPAGAYDATSNLVLKSGSVGRTSGVPISAPTWPGSAPQVVVSAMRNGSATAVDVYLVRLKVEELVG